MAYEFLKQNQLDESFCTHVRDCIATHRFRTETPPQTIEAKILYDADKLEALGALGIARALVYSGQFGKPLYIFDKDGNIKNDLEENTDDSFLKEYHHKLKNIYNNFYTKEAKIIAKRRQNMTNSFLKEFIKDVSIDSIEPLLNKRLTN